MFKIIFYCSMILSEGDYRDIRRGFLNPGTLNFYLLLGFIILFVAAITSIITFMYLKARQKDLLFEHDIKYFTSLCHDRNLTLKEIELLRHLAKKNKLKVPSMIFKNKNRFNRMIEELEHEYLKKYPPKSREINELRVMIKHIRNMYSYRKPGKGDVLTITKEIRVGQSIILFQKDFKIKKPIIGTIVHIDDNLMLAIFYNASDVFDYVAPQSKVDITFNREGDANYFFSSQILKLQHKETSKGPGYVVALRHSDTLYRTQKRRYVRLKVLIPAKLYPYTVTDEAEFHREQQHPLLCSIVDISEGGVCIEAEQPLEEEKVVTLDFNIISEYKGVLAAVVSCSKRKKRYFLHMRFVGLESGLQEHIRKYIMARESRTVK